MQLDNLMELVDRWTANYPRTATLEEELNNVREGVRQLFERLFA
jgi:hypothetical protein